MKQVALFDTEEKQFLEADGGFVWCSEYTAKCKFNHFVRYRFDSVAFSKQKRVVIKEVAIVPPQYLDDLCDSEHMLNCLEGAGVDNWSGYDYAMEAYHSDES